MRKPRRFVVVGTFAAVGVCVLVAGGCLPEGAAPDPGGGVGRGDFGRLEARVAALEARLASGGTAAAAAPAAPPGAPPQIGVPNPSKNTWRCVRVRMPPRVDGKLDDAAWRKAVQVRLVADGDGRLANEGAVLICHDAKNLYIAAVCMETDMDKLKLTCTKRDDKVYGDDCVEFYIDHDMDKQDAVKFVVNANGVFMDFIRLRHGDGDDVTWDPTVKTAKLADRYVLEIAVPLADMKVEYKPGAEIAFNAIRMRNKSGGRIFEASTWWGQINRVGSLGKVTFE